MSWGKLAASVYRSAKQVSQDPRLVSETEVKNRMDTCERCDLYNHHTKRCKECGCFRTVKNKFKGTECPIGKW